MTQEDMSDERLMALADGELPEDEAAALLKRVEKDAALAKRYAVFVDTRRVLGAALDPGPVPDRLMQTILETPAVASAPNVTLLRPRRTWPGSGIGLALAASLLLAVGIGGFEVGRRAGMPAEDAGPMAAVRATATMPTGAGVDLPGGGSARVVASFETESGFCRLIGAQSAAGEGDRILACRATDDWRVLLSVAAADTGSFVTASDAAVELIDDLLDRLGAGPALDPKAEALRLRSAAGD